MKTTLLALLLAAAQEDLDPAALPLKADVKEVAVFKDGHAFVLREAMVPPRSGWHVTLDVPEAILGTLWTVSGSPKMRVEEVRAGWEVVEEKKPCMSLQETIEAALGQEVVLTLNDAGPQPRTLEGTVAALPKVEPAVSLREAPAEALQGETVHLRTPTGIEVVRKSAVVAIRFRKEVPLEKTSRTPRRRILIRVSVAPDAGADPLPLRLVYVQKGLRWIPEYRVELLPGKKARISLQGTIVNDLADLRDVHASLVVGIPNFMLKDSLSPMALRHAAAGMAQHFLPDNRFGNDLSNAVMTQVARFDERRAPATPAPDPSVDLLVKATAADEYFLYSRPGVTLRKGERASHPLLEGTFAYEDAYQLRIGPVPPRFIAGDRHDEIQHALRSPKVVHGLRIRNGSALPWTTGPALLVRDGRALSQDLMRFTPPGGETILPVAEMADLLVRTRDTEQTRTNNVKIDGELYTQVFMKGTVTLSNPRPEALTVEVERSFYGQAEKVHAGGTSEAFDFAEVPGARASWPWWWRVVNGMFQATWKPVVEPGKTVDLSCEWSYYRR
jgi:hypothetical protein